MYIYPHSHPHICTHTNAAVKFHYHLLTFDLHLLQTLTLSPSIACSWIRLDALWRAIHKPKWRGLTFPGPHPVFTFPDNQDKIFWSSFTTLQSGVRSEHGTLLGCCVRIALQTPSLLEAQCLPGEHLGTPFVLFSDKRESPWEAQTANQLSTFCTLVLNNLCIFLFLFHLPHSPGVGYPNGLEEAVFSHCTSSKLSLWSSLYLDRLLSWDHLLFTRQPEWWLHQLARFCQRQACRKGQVSLFHKTASWLPSHSPQG